MSRASRQAARRFSINALLLAWLLAACSARETPVRVAVAANFAPTLDRIISLYADKTGGKVEASSASTGQLYAQIVEGAPFDVFLSADRERPSQLVKAGLGVEASRFVYARGQLVLWSKDKGHVDAQGGVLSRPDVGIIAIAEPRTAPYGAAAKALLQDRQLWEPLLHSGRIATAGSVTQAYQFVASGSAVMGFVALSQVLTTQAQGTKGSYWQVPTAAGALDQEAVLLQRAAKNQHAIAFLNFLRRDKMVQRLIEKAGYASR